MSYSLPILSSIFQSNIIYEIKVNFKNRKWLQFFKFEDWKNGVVIKKSKFWRNWRGRKKRDRKALWARSVCTHGKVSLVPTVCGTVREQQRLTIQRAEHHHLLVGWPLARLLSSSYVCKIEITISNRRYIFWELKHNSHNSRKIPNK